MKRRHGGFAVVLALVGTIAATPVFAAEALKAGPSQPQEARPLKNDIQLDTGMFAKSVGPAFKVTAQGISEHWELLKRRVFEYEASINGMQKAEKLCSSRSYSVQEQTAAGCAGSDTLTQCSEKLYRHCVSRDQDAVRFITRSDDTEVKAELMAEELTMYVNQMRLYRKQVVPWWFGKF